MASFWAPDSVAAPGDEFMLGDITRLCGRESSGEGTEVTDSCVDRAVRSADGPRVEFEVS